MIHIINSYKLKTCNICFQNKLIKYNCNTCNYLICRDCYRSYLQNNYRLCPQCRQIIIINSNSENSYIGHFKKKTICINKFKCKGIIFYLIVIIYPVICYFLGYWITKNYYFVILNLFLGLVISSLVFFILSLIYCVCTF